MGDTGPWVRGMGTWHHHLFTGPPFFFQKNGPDRYMELDPKNPCTTKVWFTLQWRSPPVINFRGILKFEWPRATLLCSGGLHCGQECFGGEHCTWMNK